MLLKFWNNDFEKFKTIQNIKEYPSGSENELMKKTIKYIWLIKWIPWIEMIAIWNSVAMNSANSNSDIDLFIITSPSRLWIVRIFITLIFQVLLVRKTSKKHKWKFCLSFFCTTNSLNFEKIAIENDIYLYFWMIYLKPILNYNNTWETFIEENRKWCNFDDYNQIIEENKKSIVFKKSTSNYNCKILNSLEKILKSIFLPRTKSSFKNLWNPFWVIINDNMLKFHDDDKREKISKKCLLS